MCEEGYLLFAGFCGSVVWSEVFFVFTSTLIVTHQTLNPIAPLGYLETKAVPGHGDTVAINGLTPLPPILDHKPYISALLQLCTICM